MLFFYPSLPSPLREKRLTMYFWPFAFNASINISTIERERNNL
jgi:hypothetical protein